MASKRRPESTQVPPHARPQTIGEVAVMSAGQLLIVLSPFIVIALFRYYPTVVFFPLFSYYVYIFGVDYQSHGGRPWRHYSENNSVLKDMRNFFPLKVYIPEELEAENMSDDDQFMFGMHPHGVDSVYRGLIDGMIGKTFPKLRSWRAIAASVVFRVPVLREFALWTHAIDASKEIVNKAMADGHSIFVVPGGEQEQMLTRFMKELVYIKKRKGFIKMALKHRCKIVPSYVFGCNDLFKTSDLFFDTRFSIMKKYRIALPLYWGAFGFPFAPFRVPLHAQFGRPLGPFEFEGDKPSNELVDRVHELYIEELVRVFDTHKEQFGYGDRQLKVV